MPQGLRLHQYANLYFDARNPMLYRRLNEADSLCVLAVSTAALQLEGTVITDCNAAGDYVRFLHPLQWELIDFDDVFARDWRHPGDERRYWQHKSRKCAEVLVPHRILPELILGARVISPSVKARLATLRPSLRVKVDPDMFFHTNL